MALIRLLEVVPIRPTPEGDHYRTRLTHTLEVAQIARTIARALQLNEDLTEAIALGHGLLEVVPIRPTISGGISSGRSSPARNESSISWLVYAILSESWTILCAALCSSACMPALLLRLNMRRRKKSLAICSRFIWSIRKKCRYTLPQRNGLSYKRYNRRRPAGRGRPPP